MNINNEIELEGFSWIETVHDGRVLIKIDSIVYLSKFSVGMICGRQLDFKSGRDSEWKSIFDKIKHDVENSVK